MTMKIGAKELRAALKGINSVVEVRQTIPLLANVLLVCSTRGLKLVGTDLDLQIERRVHVDATEPFTITVASKLLEGIAAKMPEDGPIKVTLPEGGGKMLLASGRARFTLATLPADDFPLMPAHDGGVSFSLAADTLATLIETVRFAISSDETRYYLNGVYLHAVDDRLRFVSTDGHRLALASVPLPAGAEGLTGAILPRKALGVLASLLDKVEDGVDIDISPSRAVFTIGDDVLTTKLIDGTFPDYTRVIPTGNDKLVKIAPGELDTAIDRVATIATEKTRLVKLTLGKDKITVAVVSPENGTATDECQADYRGPTLDVGVNVRYLRDILARLHGDAIEMVLADGAAPILLRQAEDADATFVLMPMRV